jgi:hypothetical protein
MGSKTVLDLLVVVIIEMAFDISFNCRLSKMSHSEGMKIHECCFTGAAIHNSDTGYTARF